MTIIISRLDVIALVLGVAVLVYGAGPLLAALGTIALVLTVGAIALAGAATVIGTLLWFGFFWSWHPHEPWPTIILAGLFVFGCGMLGQGLWHGWQD